MADKRNETQKRFYEIEQLVARASWLLSEEDCIVPTEVKENLRKAAKLANTYANKK